MEYYSALKRNEILIHAITRNNCFKIEKRVRQGCILSPCLFDLYAECVCSITQSCLTLYHPCSLPGSSVHGIFPARVLEWVAIASSRGYSRPRDWTVSCISCISSHLLLLILYHCTSRVHHAKCWAGWITSWNQDCWEKYQQAQICRWYHSNGRKWKRTEEPLDEGERGEWKSWLKTQHSKH